LDELTGIAIEAAIEAGIDASAVDEAVEQAADGMFDLLIEAGGAEIAEGGATTVYADEHEALTQLPKKRVRDACGIVAKETIGD
jgi:SHS2 domain-containing protein